MQRNDGESSQDGLRQPSIETSKVSLRERLNHFTWSWFECTMSTGAMATLLAHQPHKFTGLMTIGKIFFVLDLVLFAAFSVCITVRFALNRGALSLSLHHPRESFFFGTFWVSIAFILYGAHEYGEPACGPWLVRALEILFWGYAGCALLVVVFQYHVIFDEEQLPVAEAMPAWLLPAYPFLVLGPLAAALLASQPPDRGLPMLIGGILFEGFGWSVAFIMYTLYFTRLINSEVPAERERPGMYVAVGPAAYTSNTLMSLGVQAPRILPHDYLGIRGSVPTGDFWKAVGVPAGLFVWLLGFWFFALASIAVARGWRRVSFSLTCWSFVFPQAGLTIAAAQAAEVLDSDGIRGVVSAATVLLVAAWLLTAAATVKGVWTRQVLWPGRDDDMEDAEEHGGGGRPADEEFAVAAGAGTRDKKKRRSD